MEILELAQSLSRDIASRAAEADRNGRLPAADVEMLKDSGYLGLNISKDFGGFGQSMHACVEAQLELAQGSASTAIVAAMPLQVFGNEIHSRQWSPEHFEQFCTQGARGTLFNSVASEPQLGSPSRGGLPATFADRSEAGWVLQGRKTWITGGQHLTHMLVRCRIEDDAAVLLVHQDSPGLAWAETWRDALSLRASDSHDVEFNQVDVPASNLVLLGGGRPKPNAWFPMMLASVYLGTAIAARNDIIRYALERIPTALGKPIATLPKIQRQIGELDIQLMAARGLLIKAASDWDQVGEKALKSVTAGKQFAVDSARAITEKALEIAGGAGLTTKLPFERYFRDVRPGMMQPPSGDTAFEAVGRAAIEALSA